MPRNGEPARRRLQQAALTGAIAEVPETLQPLEVLYWAFRSVEQALEDNRPFSVPRQQVILNTPALQERELAKEAALTEDMAVALRYRGVDKRLAGLAAQTGMAVFQYAAVSWFADPSRRLGAYLDDAFDALWRLSSPLIVTEARRHQ